MNNTIDSSDNSDNLGEFYIEFGVIIGVLVLLIIIIIAYYLRSQECLPAHSYHHNSSSVDDLDSITIELDLHETTLLNYPKLLYTEAKLQKGDSMSCCCSICLSDYKDNDMLLLLPKCDHLFHLNCIHPWLMLHPTCPICRSSPTSLTKTAPMALRRESFSPWFVPFLH